MTPHSDRNRALQEKYGPWAVVTGASSGIGKEIACQLAESGLHLLLVSRRLELLEELASHLSEKHGIEARTLGLDLAPDTSLTTLIEATSDLDVGLFVAASGFGTSGRFIDSSLVDELEMLSINCRSVLEQTHHFGNRFAERGKGGLILMGSIVGFQGTPLTGHYAATKAYIQSLAEALHDELASSGVDVLSSAPGPTHSGFADRAGMVMGNALSPETVARETIRALGKKGTVLPGFLTKFLTYSLAMLPRWARVRVMGQVMKGMTDRSALHPENKRQAT